MKRLTLNLSKKLLILNHETKEYMEASWDYTCSFGKQTEMLNGNLIKPLFKGTFMTEEDYRSLISDEKGSVSISKHPKAYLVSYSRHKNAFKDLIEKEGFYWLDNPNGNQPHNIGLINTYPTGHSLMDLSLKEAINWQESESRTLKYPIIFEILE